VTVPILTFNVPKPAVPKKHVPKVYVPKLSCTESDVPLITQSTRHIIKPPQCRELELELELELDASADLSHPTDDNGEESYSLYISPIIP